jgi:hypothetical protein
MGAPPDAAKDRASRWGTLVIGLVLIWLGEGSLPRPTGAPPGGWDLFLPVVLIIFGTVFTLGSAIVLWKGPGKAQKPMKGEGPDA